MEIVAKPAGPSRRKTSTKPGTAITHVCGAELNVPPTERRKKFARSALDWRAIGRKKTDDGTMRKIR